MMEYSVRKALPEDIGRLCSLEAECFSSPWSEGAFESSMRDDSFIAFVCEYDTETVGYIGGVCVLDECSVTNVAVTARHRRCGVARMLLDTLEMSVGQKGVSAVYLEVRVSNAAAVSLYESRGYECCGVRRGFYSCPREDAYVYKKLL